MADHGGTRYVFQAKDHRGPAGNRAVQQAVAAKAITGTARCGVISSNGFTRQARELAAANYCLLIDYRTLEDAASCGKSFTDVIGDHDFSDSMPVEHDYDVVSEYEEAKSRLGHTPRNKDLTPATRYRIKKTYGNLSRLVESVGDVPYTRRPSDEDIVREYKRVRDIVGRTPTLDHMSANSSYSLNCFASYPFTELQKVCGDRPNIKRGASKQELIEAFKDLAKHLGRTPTVSELDDKGTFRSSYYRNRWGSMDAFRREMGLSRRELGQMQYEKRELVAIVLLLKEALKVRQDDPDPRVNHTVLDRLRFGDSPFISPSTVSRRFGSWDSFLAELDGATFQEFSNALDNLIGDFLRRDT